MIDVQDIINLQTQTVVRWHKEPIKNDETGFFATVCTQHSFNYQLWHEEDIARSPDVSDQQIAKVKRSIDRFNQQRNDWIEKLDDQIAEMVSQAAVEIDQDAQLNTETPGSAIDRLSIMALRLYHLEEQLNRDNASEQHRQSVQQKISVCRLQQSELAKSLQQLIDAIAAGKKRHLTYRQFKMYNDPTLNPYLYNAKSGSEADSDETVKGAGNSEVASAVKECA
jgi:cell division protein FtsB